MKEAVAKPDLAETGNHLPATPADPKAAIEAERRRLKAQLGIVLIANLIATGAFIFASALLLAP
jgi:hypothetical protein